MLSPELVAQNRNQWATDAIFVRGKRAAGHDRRVEELEEVSCDSRDRDLFRVRPSRRVDVFQSVSGNQLESRRVPPCFELTNAGNVRLYADAESIPMTVAVR